MDYELLELVGNTQVFLMHSIVAMMMLLFVKAMFLRVTLNSCETIIRYSKAVMVQSLSLVYFQNSAMMYVVCISIAATTYSCYKAVRLNKRLLKEKIDYRTMALTMDNYDAGS